MRNASSDAGLQLMYPWDGLLTDTRSGLRLRLIPIDQCNSRVVCR
jgi:hypothetical protein